MWRDSRFFTVCWRFKQTRQLLCCCIFFDKVKLLSDCLLATTSLEPVVLNHTCCYYGNCGYRHINWAWDTKDCVSFWLLIAGAFVVTNGPCYCMLLCFTVRKYERNAHYHGKGNLNALCIYRWLLSVQSTKTTPSWTTSFAIPNWICLIALWEEPWMSASQWVAFMWRMLEAMMPKVHQNRARIRLIPWQ